MEQSSDTSRRHAARNARAPTPPEKKRRVTISRHPSLKPYWLSVSTRDATEFAPGDRREAGAEQDIVVGSGTALVGPVREFVKCRNPSY